MTPGPGDSGFAQWLSAMQMVARLPGGIPPEFRRTLWLTLADKHLQRRGVDWAQAERLCFSEWSNPSDDELGVQIVKDLHRTGCSMFCGQSNQAVLKRVLLAYARWNKAVGYCQGFNMLAALILQVMDRNEPDSVKVMIYLIEGVLPESYFANNLRGLSVDMAVFRDLLRLRLPQLSRHLEHLQMEAGDNTGTSYEPPLTNVFTMQWFLTLFCNCLPQPTVLRVWDLIFLEGNQVLLRTALAIWDVLADRIMTVSSADEFYSIMGVLTREILEFNLMDSNRLIKTVVALQCPELPALRDKYMYNITPWTSTVSSGLRRGLRLFYTEDDSGDSGDNSEDDDSEKIAVAAAFGIADLFRSPRRRGSVNAGASSARGLGGGSGGGVLSVSSSSGPPERERLSLDVSMLKQQYSRLRERQRQAQIILTAACGGAMDVAMGGASLSGPAVAMNHLLLGKPALRSAKGRRLPPPPGAVPPRSPAPAAPSQKRDSQPSPVETIHWKDEDKRRKSLADGGEVPAPRRRSASSDSSSSSTSTELCDEAGQPSEEEDHASPRLLPTDPKVADLLQGDVQPEPKTADLLQDGGLSEPKVEDLLQSDRQLDSADEGFILGESQQESKTADLLQLDVRSETKVLDYSPEQDIFDPLQNKPTQPQVPDLFQDVRLESQVGDLVQERPNLPEEDQRPEPKVSDLLQIDELSRPRLQDLDLLPRQVTSTDVDEEHVEDGKRELPEEDLVDWDATPQPRRDEDFLLGAPTDVDASVVNDMQSGGLETSGHLEPPAEPDLPRESPEQVVASVTERLRLIMEHLEHGLGRSVSRTPSEDPTSARESLGSSETLSSKESRQRLMDKLFGREDSMLGSESSIASLKSSVLDLGDLLDEAKANEELLERARSAAGDVEGVTASGRHNKLDRQNSEKASRIIRENSEILQRVWRERSLTLPERSEPPDFLTSSPIKRNPPVPEDGAEDGVEDRLVDTSPSRLAAEEEEKDTFPTTPSASESFRDRRYPESNGRVGLSRTLSREIHSSRRYPDLPLPKQTSLDESRSPSTGPVQVEKLQLILDHAFSSLEASLSSDQPRPPGRPRYKFPEMSPLSTSPLQPLPGTSILRTSNECPSEAQPKKWRPQLTPPGTPVRQVDDVGPRVLCAKSPTPTPTPTALPALPVQTPSFLRDAPSTSSPSSPSPPSRQAGRRKKATSPEDDPPALQGVTSSGLRSPITFNPFPSRTSVRQPKEIGVKLGLYPSSNLAKKTDRL